MRLASVCLMPAAVLLAGTASAQTNVTLVPSVSLGAVYDGNIFARAHGSAGQMTQLRPSLETRIESPRFAVLSLYSSDMIHSNQDALTSLDARRHALVDAQVRTTPETTFAMTTRYDRTETPGEINLESGVLSDRTEAQRWQFTPSVTHRVSSLTAVTGAYDRTSEDLVGDQRNVLDTLRAGFSHQMSTRTSLTAGYVARYFEDGPGLQMSNALMAGWTHAFSPATRVEAQAGPRLTSYEGVAAEVLATLTRTTHRAALALDYWRGETIVLGIRGPVAVSSATARMIVPVTRTTEVGALAGMSDITSLQRSDATVYHATVIGSWTPRHMLTLAGSYGVDYQLGDIRRTLFADQHVLRHVVRVTMTVAPRLTRSTLPPDEAARAKGVLR